MARSRWPDPGGPVPVARPRSLPSVLPWSGGPVPRSRSRSRLLCRSAPGPGPGPGPCPCLVPVAGVPVPIKRITYAVWPASSSPFQEYGGSKLFSKPLVRGKPYCEVGTIIEQKQEPNSCQSQLLDMKTLDVASLAAVFLERLRSRCCLPGVCFLEPF